MDEQTLIYTCAHAAHEANRAYNKAISEPMAVEWERTTAEHQRAYARGVVAVLRGATPEQQHEAWVVEKTAAGWKPAEHPCMVPWSELTEKQRRKDALFIDVVCAMAKACAGIV
jgi:hypothetical protein